ncbi:MAG TPA: XRE family transcriptional regulator [Terriglobales bacterium]|nr:XRE family transcriptional regulator [Terriglobales bacterium]
MDPASHAENQQRVREELQRMALEELRNAKEATQSDMAELLAVPQSSISRIEQRADMYLSTLRNYIQAMGGVLQIQAMFPDGTVVINRFGEYEDRPYVVYAQTEGRGSFQLRARPWHNEGEWLCTKILSASGFIKAMKALHLPDPQIAAIRKTLERAEKTEVGGIAGQRVFSAPDLVAAGFEAADFL